MGDNLRNARSFVLVCQQQMTALSVKPEPEHKSAIDALSKIESQAKLMRARAIARMAQITIHDLLRTEKPNLNQQSLLGLEQLIAQYQTGLCELEAEFEAEKAKAGTAQPRALVMDNDSTDKAAGDSLADRLTKLMRAHEAAKITLGETLKLAKADEKPALESLIKFTPAPPPSKTGPARRHADKPEVKAAASFETIMPVLTSEVLRFARQQNKSVSVSFAADPLPVHIDILSLLERALTVLGQKIVNQTVETPQRRQFLGLSGSAHMALTARDNGGFLDIDLSCEGQAPASLIDDPAVLELKAMGAKAKMSFDGGWLRFELLHVPVKGAGAAAEKPTAPQSFAQENLGQELAV